MGITGPGVSHVSQIIAFNLCKPSRTILSYCRPQRRDIHRNLAPGNSFCFVNMWRMRLSRTWDWIRSRTLVGEDKHHLFYSEFVSKGKPERRYVEFKDQNITHSSDRMSIEWWSWLHNRRDNIPTVEEIQLSERQQQRLAERVAVLEAEDEKQRLRQFAGTSPKTKATEEEVKARRRKKALLGLINAAVPPGQSSEDSLSTRPFVPPAKHGSEGRNMNHEEDPTVFSNVLLTVLPYCLHSSLTKLLSHIAWIDNYCATGVWRGLSAWILATSPSQKKRKVERTHRNVSAIIAPSARNAYHILV